MPKTYDMIDMENVLLKRDNKALADENRKMREALTPSIDTKAEYMGEFKFKIYCVDEDGDEHSISCDVPWTTIKEIMAAIRRKALDW